MPILECQSEGKSGHKFGESGKCFTGSGSRAKAARQGRAIKARQAAAGRKVAEEHAAQFGKAGHLSGQKKRRRRTKSGLIDQHREREMARRGKTQTTDRTQFEVDEVRFGKRGLDDLRERRRLHRINHRRQRLGRPLLGVGPDVTFAFRDLSSASLEDGGKLVAEQDKPKKKRRDGLFGRFSRQSEAPREESFSTGPTSENTAQAAGLIFPASLRGEPKKEGQQDALARLFATDAAGLMAEPNVGLAEKGLSLTKEEGLQVLRAMSRVVLSIRTPDLKKIEKGETAATRVDPCRLKKIDEEKHLVWGEVYIPLLPDSQGDFMTAAEIEKAAYRFATQGRLNEIDCMHDGDTDNAICVVETFIARAEDPIFIEGAWVICCHIPDKEIWEGVKSGQFNGFSMEGLAVRHEKQFEIDLPEMVAGVTQKEEGHTHPFHIKFSPQGEFLGGLAEPEGAQGSDIHSHGIQKGTITEVGGATPHVHRYSFVEGVLEVAIGRVPPSPEQVVQAG